jgi:hypothetical protein
MPPAASKTDRLVVFVSCPSKSSKGYRAQGGSTFPNSRNKTVRCTRWPWHRARDGATAYDRRAQPRHLFHRSVNSPHRQSHRAHRHQREPADIGWVGAERSALSGIPVRRRWRTAATGCIDCNPADSVRDLRSGLTIGCSFLTVALRAAPTRDAIYYGAWKAGSSKIGCSFRDPPPISAPCPRGRLSP